VARSAVKSQRYQWLRGFGEGQVANAVFPVYRHLVELSADGKLFHIDDTRVRILSCYREDKDRSEKERRATHTSGIVVKDMAGRKIALYFSGRRHAGENLEATNWIALRDGWKWSFDAGDSWHFLSSDRYKKALDSFAEARKLIELGSDNDGVFQAIGGSHVIFADRLPKELRGEAWARAYEAYQIIWKQQAPYVGRLPTHFKGELLAGLAQSSQRTGRTEELAQYLDKILELLRDTPYEAVARQWKNNPASASGSGIACMTCHEEGRLNARLTSLNKQ
jgi:hypothetical protein